MENSYEQDQYWTKYQPFLPEKYRCPSPNPLPKEEWWPWNGYSVHVDRVDVPGSPLKVIVLHGAGGYGRLLAPFGYAVSQNGYSWIAPDLPGYGLTAPRKRSLEYGQWVDAIVELIDHELKRDGKPVVLFGGSLGGMLAYQAASRSGKVSGIMATTLMDVRDPQVMRAISKHEAFGAIGIFLMKNLRFLIDPMMIPIAKVSKMDRMSNNAGFSRIILRDKIGGDNWIPVRFLRTLMETGVDVEPERSRVPLLLVHPGADTWTPYALSEPFFNRLGGPKKLVLLENCGHAPIEEPGIDQLSVAIEEFLESLRAVETPA